MRNHDAARLVDENVTLSQICIAHFRRSETVVDDFIDRVMADPRLNKNPRVNEAHHRVPPAGFKYLVTEMVCWAAGGPQKYSGRSMAESHKDLSITSDEWAAFLDDLQQTLVKFAVPPTGASRNEGHRE
jgi:truncated hemoglobin YjbI